MSQYSRDELIARATLTTEDLSQVNQCRRTHNRIGFAYQVAFVKLTNCFPAQHAFEVIDELLTFVSAQLQIPADEIDRYLQRQATVSEHQVRIRRYLNLQAFSDEELSQLQQYLFDQCCRLEKTSALTLLAEDFLRDRGILKPASSTLSRIIGEQRKRARNHMFNTLAGSIPAAVKIGLDKLLEVGDGRKSPLQSLKDSPGVPSPQMVGRLTSKLTTIRDTGILAVDLSWVNNNYQRFLAKFVRRCSADKVRRAESSHRYSAMACFLWQTFRDTIDHLVDMQDKLVNKVCNKAQNQCDEALRKRQQSIRRSVSMLRTIARIVLDKELEDSHVRTAVFRHIPEDELAFQIQDADDLLSPKNSHMFHGVVQRYQYVRKFFPDILKNLQYCGQNGDASSILKAVEVLKEVNEDGKRSLPEEVPLDFIPKSLQSFVLEDGQVNKQAWECALLIAIRDEIKSGNVVVSDSKRFGSFDRFFIEAEKWEPRREAFFRRAGLPVSPNEIPEYLSQRLNKAIDSFLETQPENAFVSFGDDGWRLSTDPSEKLEEEAEQKLDYLKKWLSSRMRTTRLPELLIEVDNELRFTRHFMGNRPEQGRSVDDVCATIATIMAHGCNIGPYTMARLTEGVSYSQIKRITDWRITEESQRAALADVVSAISTLGTSQVWGEGKASSSDGQRYLFPRRVLQRTFSHKMSDFALEFYSFVADNYAPFYSTPIECTDRDAAYVLDGLLYNESDLALEEHYTDTHGYTEINFAAFAMLGKRFCPRIRGLHHQRIYRIGTDRSYGLLTPLVAPSDRTIHMDWICQQWDRMGQFYASLESGHTTASVALKRLAGYSKKNMFYKANRELGRVFKTEFILQYMSQSPLRQRVRKGLLKGEQLHNLARDVCYGKRGRISSRSLHEQMNTCSCLTLILACIIYWQAKELERVMSAAGPDDAIEPALLEHVSPIEWENVVLYGQYVIDRSLVRAA